jgi:hypothetical protein
MPTMQSGPILDISFTWLFGVFEDTIPVSRKKARDYLSPLVRAPCPEERSALSRLAGSGAYY